jgi:predicted transposase/invertase (TIGR01784 family)
MNMTRNFKDSIFSAYFSDEKTLLDAYSAIQGRQFTADTEIIFNTLDDVLFKSQLNDISFTVNGKIIVLVEHQSTVCQNLPIRMLQYLGRIYEKTLDKRNLYRNKLYTIPKPEFIVLYNGTEPLPDHSTLKLSDAFEEVGTPESIELTVNVYNINMRRNADILSKSKSLNDYATFIDLMRTSDNDDLETRYRKVINYCIENNIMSDFLMMHGSEVYNMLLTEWNMDDALDVRYEEGVEYGVARGIEQGLEQGLAQGVAKGLEQGVEQGRIDAARRMKNDGVEAAFIAKYTGLTIAEINEIS